MTQRALNLEESNINKNAQSQALSLHPKSQNIQSTSDVELRQYSSISTRDLVFPLVLVAYASFSKFESSTQLYTAIILSIASFVYCEILNQTEPLYRRLVRFITLFCLIGMVGNAAENTGGDLLLYCTTIILLLGALTRYGLSWLYNDCTLILDELSLNVSVIYKTENQEPIICDMPVEALNIGDTLRYSSSQIIHADGIVVSGLSEVEERTVSGLSEFRVKGVGDSVYAGSTILSGTIDIKIDSLPSNSLLNRFVSHIRAELSSLKEYQETLSSRELVCQVCLVSIALAVSVSWYFYIANTSYAFQIASSILLLQPISIFYSLAPYLARHLLLSSFSRGVVTKDFLNVQTLLKPCSHLAIEYPLSIGMVGKDAVSNFQILDSRVDPDALSSVLVSVLGRSSVSSHSILAEVLRGRISVLRLYQMSEADMEADPSIAIPAIKANVEGVLLYFGSEDWLISQGVQLQLDEVYHPQVAEKVWYIALNKEVVAYAVFKDESVDVVTRFVDEMKKERVRISLLSDRSADELTQVATTLKLPLNDIFPLLSEEGKINKLSSFREVCFLASDGTQTTVKAAGTPSVAWLSGSKPEFSLQDVTICSGDLLTFRWFWAASAKFRNILKFQKILAIIASVILVALSGFGLLIPIHAALIASFICGFIFFHR